MAMSAVVGTGDAAPAANRGTIARRTAPVVSAVAAGLILSGLVPETVFLALAVAVGLPHGALDHLVGRGVFGARHGASWWRPFLAGYIALVAAMLLAWWTLPGLALLTFLGLSLFHFGDEDALAEPPSRIVRVMAHGGAVIVVPAFCHPVAVERLFAMLAPVPASGIEAFFGGPLAVLWAATATATLVIYAVRGRKADRSAALDLVLVTLLFAFATPLVAFSLYFAAIHTPRALATTLAAHRRNLSGMAVPTLLTLLGLGLGIALFAANRGGAVDETIVRSTFMLLSALTVPHMWLDWRARTAHQS